MTTTEHPKAEFPSDEPAALSVSGIPEGSRSSDAGGVRSHRGLTLLAATAGYLLLSVMLWWHVWSNHPTSTTTCGCGDSSLFTWFLAWPAYAFSHGLDPLYSTAMFHPAGVNLLSNTAEVGIGVVLAPVTWLFGAVATFNVALTLSPVLSALAMFVLLRRWVRWTPAAFIGGLFYGFSPFVLIALTDGHLMEAMTPIPPLIVACLDELLIRQRRAPLVTGAVLGLLVSMQFFIGSEALVLTAIIAGLGVVIVMLCGLGNRAVLRRRARHAATALVAAVVTGAVLLAYPVWFALAGPAHLSGPIWGNSLISYGGTSLKAFLFPSAPAAAPLVLARRFGGYQAPTLSPQFFGIGLVAVLVIGLIIWRRDRRLWLFGVLGAFSIALSDGLRLHGWTLWRLFVRFPQMDNIIPSRFVVTTYLAAAVMLGLIIDHTYAGVNRWSAATRASHGRGSVAWRRMAGAGAGVVVAVIALVPIVSYFSDAVPLTTQPVALPTWFRTVAPHLSERQVVLDFPVPFYLNQSAMTWQAVDGMSYSMVGGGGPNSIIQRAGKEAAGQKDIGAISISIVSQVFSEQQISAVRKALDGWGVTIVVVPDTSQLPSYERVHLVRATTVLLTAAIGRRPVRQADAWVWTGVDHAGPPILSATQVTGCAAGSAGGSVASIDRSTACVLAAPMANP